MTVKELIKRLEVLPPNQTVVTDLHHCPQLRRPDGATHEPQRPHRVLGLLDVSKMQGHQGVHGDWQGRRAGSRRDAERPLPASGSR